MYIINLVDKPKIPSWKSLTIVIQTSSPSVKNETLQAFNPLTPMSD